jgi:ubiquitin C-terminal hydrolase
MNVPLEFSHIGETYDLQGGVCFQPGMSGEGHYTAVCLRSGRLVLYTDAAVCLDTAKIKCWLQRCRMLLYASSIITALRELSLTFLNRARHN